MFRATIAAILVTISLSATPIAAATLTGSYSGLVVFGDSLSDNGNIFAQSGGTFPPPPYDAGRFSNGPVWNDPLIAAFQASGQGAVNLAFGGARAQTNADAVPDFGAQIALYKSTDLDLLFDHDALVSVFFGGNDLRDVVFAAAGAFVGGATTETIDAIILSGATSAARAVGTGIEALADLDLANFAVWNAPNLGLVPEVTAFGPLVSGFGTQAAIDFNAALGAELARIRASRPTLALTTVDLFATITAAVADPTSVGLVDVTTPCLSATFAACAAPDTTLFWDTIHPTAAGHALLTAAFEDAVPVVPLPVPALLLVAGLGTLLVLRRRV